MTPVLFWFLIGMIAGCITAIFIWIDVRICRRWRRETVRKSNGIVVLRLMYILLIVCCIGLGIIATALSFVHAVSLMF